MANTPVGRSAAVIGSPGETLTSRPSRSSKRLRTLSAAGITEVSDMFISSQNRREDLVETFGREGLDDEERRTGGLRRLLHLRCALRRHEAELDVVAGRPQLAQHLDAGQLR